MENARDRRRRIRRANLILILARVGGAVELARQCGKKDGFSKYYLAISADDRGMGDDVAKQIEDALTLGEGWMDKQHTDAGAEDLRAATRSQRDPPGLSDELPLLSWEQIMAAKDVPEVFRTVLPDDALAPEYPRGAEVVWTKRRRVMGDRLVLVIDQHGMAHARRARQGREPGRFLFEPVNSAYVTFDSTEVRLVAVFKGRLEPDDE